MANLNGDTSAGETREDIGLKTGTKLSNYMCNCDEDCIGGPKFISISFAVLTAVITVALFVQIYYGDFQVVPHGSVATDSRECSEIGTVILKLGGNAVDASIASTFCLAVTNPHTTGLDAEGQFMIYNHKLRSVAEVIDFSKTYGKINEHIPKLVKGLAYIHQLYGKLPWKSLLEPASNLAMRGFLVPKTLASAIIIAKANKLYGKLEPGQTLKLEVLANTLRSISEIAEEDLSNYITVDNTPSISSSLKYNFKNYNIYVPNTPAIGPELLVLLQNIAAQNFTQSEVLKPDYVYKLAADIQQVYTSYNVTARFHEGTSSNVAVMDLDDTYVSIVTGMFQPFGTQQMTIDGYLQDEKSVGLPICSRLPIIITDNGAVCGRRLVLGAANAVVAAQLVSALLVGAENATAAIESPRFDVYGNGSIGLEDDHTPLFNDDVVQFLEQLGSLMHIKQPYSSSNVVEKISDDLSSHSDSRGGGISSRF